MVVYCREREKDTVGKIDGVDEDFPPTILSGNDFLERLLITDQLGLS